MSAKFRNSTALVAAFSLAIPAVSPAQTMVERCEAGSVGISAEAATELDLTLTDDQEAALAGEATSDTVIVSTFDDDTPKLCMTMAELEAMGASEADVMMVVEAEAAAEEPGLLEQALDAVTGGGEEAEVAETPAEPAAEAEAEVEAEVEAAPESDALLEALPGAEADVASETEAEAEVEAEAAETAETEVEAEVDVEAETTAETEAEVEETTEGNSLQEALNDVTGNNVQTPEALAEGEAAAEAEADTEAEVTAQAEAEAEAAPGVTGTVQELAEQIEAQSAEEADPEEQAALAEEDAPEASAAIDETTEAAEVEEVTVTEENARSSSEEFRDQVTGVLNGNGGQAGNDDGGGLSDLEKALLVGVGAVVVGKALEGNDKAQVVTKSEDRVVVLEDGRYRVIRDDNELIERPGSTVRRETFQDGSTRTIVTRDNGVQIITIRDPELRVLRRVRIDADGNRTVLIDDTADVDPVDVAELPDPVAEVEVDAGTDAETLRAILSTKSGADRRFALYQVRNIERVRKLAPAIDLEAINFRTGSAVIDPQEAQELADLGNLIAAYVAENPGELFLVEGHTDAVGNAAYNLALSDRRAESVALALTEYFDVPPENLVVQGYGESDLKVKTLDAERANRRAAVRRITPLITGGS